MGKSQKRQQRRRQQQTWSACDRCKVYLGIIALVLIIALMAFAAARVMIAFWTQYPEFRSQMRLWVDVNVFSWARVYANWLDINVLPVIRTYTMIFRNVVLVTDNDTSVQQLPVNEL